MSKHLSYSGFRVNETTPPIDPKPTQLYYYRGTIRLIFDPLLSKSLESLSPGGLLSK